MRRVDGPSHAEGPQDHGGLGGEGGDRQDGARSRGIGEQVGEVAAPGERALAHRADGDAVEGAAGGARDGEAVVEL